MKRVKYSVAVLAGICFVYLAFNFNEPALEAVDAWVRALVKDNAFIISFHYLGEPVVAATVGIALILFLALREKDYRGMLFVLLIFAGGNGWNQLLKRIVQRPRPDIADQLTTYSFPSGHTMAGFFMLMTVAYFLARATRATKKSLVIWFMAIVLALVVGLSRIAEGRHFATDVLAGWCIGYVWFTLCVWWYESRKEYLKRGE